MHELHFRFPVNLAYGSYADVILTRHLEKLSFLLRSKNKAPEELSIYFCPSERGDVREAGVGFN